jgi:hypothetical protein
MITSFLNFFLIELIMALQSTPSLQEDLKNLLMYLYYVSPAYNVLVQMLFILPQKATTLMKMYPELMEREDELLKLFSLRFTSDGFLETSNHFGYHLSGLYRSLFRILSDPYSRNLLLELANLSEEEFRKFDPLRSWIEVSLEYLAKVNKEALKLLDAVVDNLSGKKPDESISFEELGKSVGIENFEASLRLLKGFSLLLPSSAYSIYGKECPLLLEAYSDLRTRLKELLR